MLESYVRRRQYIACGLTVIMLYILKVMYIVFTEMISWSFIHANISILLVCICRTLMEINVVSLLF